MKDTQTISRKALGEIYPTVCLNWKVRVADLVMSNPSSDKVEVPNSMIEEAYKAADQKMRKTYSYRPNGPYYETKKFWKRLGLDVIRPWRLFGFNPFQWRLFWYSVEKMFPYVITIKITRKP